MKLRKTFLFLFLAALTFTGGCTAADFPLDQTASESTMPEGVSLSAAAGAMLRSAQSDLAEVQAYVQRSGCSLPFQDTDDIVIYDCGTQTVGDYDVSTTLYTDAVRSAPGQTGGVAVHTYTQSGSVRFKVYFMISFSFDGTHVSPMWNLNETWTSDDAAILSCSLPEDDYEKNGACTLEWIYSVDDGTTAVKDQKAHMSCTTSGAVT